MPSPAEKSRVVHFGLFEVDLHEQELRKSGIRIKLQEQPFQILALLLEHPGQTVTREELRQKLWPIDTFVDFDHGLNSSVKKLRLALGDDSGNPRFIETLHRRGYRFIAPVDGIPPAAIDPAQRIAIPASTEATPSAAQFSSPTAVAAPKRRSWGLVAGAIAAMILVGGAGFGVYWRFARPAPRPFQNFVVTQVTNSGKVKSAAISPDGRYVASVIDDKGMQSLWLRNLPTGSNTQIIPASSSLYGILRFSPDGNYIYFLRSQNQYWNGYDLYRCPVLGGAPQEIVRNVNHFAFSRDGQRLAYARLNDPEPSKFQILTATLEGENETVWQTASTAEQPHSLSWSREGNELYYSTYSRGDEVSAIDALDMRTRKLRRFATFKDKFFYQICWSPDGLALFVNYCSAATTFRWQIGFLTRAGRDIEPITRDANNYAIGRRLNTAASRSGFSISSDGKTLATVLAKVSGTINVLSKLGRKFGEPVPILSESQNDVFSLDWGSDGNLILNSAIRVLRVGVDGKSQTQLLADSSAYIKSFFSCGTKYFVLAWQGRAGSNAINLWRVNTDGSGLMKLTKGKFDYGTVCSPDQKWVYYIDILSQRIMRVPLDGSAKSEAVFDVPPNHFFGTGLTISRDSRRIVASVEKPGEGANIALFDLGSSSPPRMFSADIFSDGVSELRPTHDGDSVAYVKRQNGVDNMWVNRLDGFEPYRITDFTSDEIWGFSFSPDGKRLAILRGHTESDVVLLQETRH